LSRFDKHPLTTFDITPFAAQSKQPRDKAAGSLHPSVMENAAANRLEADISPRVARPLFRILVS
jgi:hypothetical protein